LSRKFSASNEERTFAASEFVKRWLFAVVQKCPEK